MIDQDTIVAPATPPGVSALAIIRTSGPLVSLIAQKIFKQNKLKPRFLYYKKAYAITNDKSDEIIDSLTFVYYQGPHSYTGEDTLEIFPHGNPLIVKKLIKEILKIDGIRTAQPGEFTRRAFEYGKMDLVQAEAVNDVIHATNQSTLKNAHKLLDGKLSNEIKQLAEQVKTISAHLELEVDFAEDETDAEQDAWYKSFEKIVNTLELLQQGYKDNARINRIPTVVIMGAPNAGKSSLINALLKEDRILVSQEAGTTRDFIETQLLLKRGEVRLIDTAGLSANPINELDRLSMEKSRKVIERADFILEIIDGTNLKNNSPIEPSRTNNGNNIVHQLLASKADLEGFICPENAMAISAAKTKGIETLKQMLEVSLFSSENESEDFWLANERQSEAVSLAIEALKKAMSYINDGIASPEFLAFELQIARDSLANVIGEISTDDILTHIFNGFCIGK